MTGRSSTTPLKKSSTFVASFSFVFSVSDGEEIFSVGILKFGSLDIFKTWPILILLAS